MYSISTSNNNSLKILIYKISVVPNTKNKNTNATNKHISLIKLKLKALKLDFKVARRVDQKLIKKKEVSPINSHPKNNVKKLLLKIRRLILAIKLFNQNVKEASSASFLK